MTSWLYPGPFKTTYTPARTHSLHPSQAALSLLVGKELARSTPGYFGKPLRTCVSYKQFSLPSALATRREAMSSLWGAPQGQGGWSRLPGKRRERGNPRICPWATGGK